MKAIAMVAHPDDCVIFAYSFINHHKEYDWTICYLTYTEHDPRGKELSEFWNRRGIKTKFLGYVDDWHDLKTQKISFDTVSASQDIHNAIADQDLVLTHNSEGEYGHLHHVFVNQATSNHPNRIIFAGPGQGIIEYTIDPGTYSLDELPMHGNIIKEFFPDNIHQNSYTKVTR